VIVFTLFCLQYSTFKMHGNVSWEMINMFAVYDYLKAMDAYRP